jgi:mRNA-degrading endonuclease YafQ of YafQ-DinJ toxin-antitoxin module
MRNPDDTRLDRHPLTKKMGGKWAFSITDDIRIVYEWLGKNTVRFLAIGKHRKVYFRKSS